MQQASQSILDETAIAVLEEASESACFDASILRSAPAQDMRMQIEKIIRLLQEVSPHKLLRHQGILSRLTGANIEARLEFETSAHKVFAAVELLRNAASHGKYTLAKLKEGRASLFNEQARLEHAIALGKQVLAESDRSDAFLSARYDRRLSNIMALHVANITTIEQIGLAEELLTAMLDRVTDVENLLIPLWQREVIAVVHAHSPAEKRQAAKNFIEIHEKFISYLIQGRL